MEAAASIYARIIFPSALSEREPHLSNLQKAMLDATPDCIKVISIEGKLLAMNRAGCLALNVPEESSFGMPWLPLLPEDVRAAGEQALREAVEGRNGRFPGKSLSPDGIRYWDNLLTPLIDASKRVLSILCVSRDVTANAQLELALEKAISREKLLSREMQHRIKNLFSVVLGLISLAEKETIGDKAPETATNILRAKLGALSRAMDTAFSDEDIERASKSSLDLTRLVSSVLQPYGDRCSVTGNQAPISRNTATTLALILHELATNSVKHGALGNDAARVTIRWTAANETLDLTWVETGGLDISASPQHNGFGSAMIDRLVRSAGGTINRIWLTEGLATVLNLPNLVCD